MWRIRHMCHLTLLVGWKLARAVLACYKVSMPERLLTATEVHTRLACSRTQLHYLTRDGKFPQPVKIGRSIRWRESGRRRVDRRAGGRSGRRGCRTRAGKRRRRAARVRGRWRTKISRPGGHDRDGTAPWRGAGEWENAAGERKDMPTTDTPTFCTLCNVSHTEHHKTDCQGRHFRPAGSFQKPKKKKKSKKRDASAPAPVDRPEPTQATCYNHEQLAARWIDDNAGNMVVRPDGTWRIWKSGTGWTAYDPLAEMAALGGSVFHRWTQDGPKPDVRYGGSLSTAQACERLSRPAMQHDRWDADLWLLGLTDGLVADLRTGKVRPVEKDDYISRAAGGQPADTWNPESRWGQFVAAAIPQDCLEWFQRACGYAATGLTTEEVLLFLYGSANTGKGTIPHGDCKRAGRLRPPHRP